MKKRNSIYIFIFLVILLIIVIVVIDKRDNKKKPTNLFDTLNISSLGVSTSIFINNLNGLLSLPRNTVATSFSKETAFVSML